MRLKPISNESEYDYWLNWVDEAFDKQIKPGTIEGDKLSVVLLLIKDYEDKNYSIPSADPIEVIKLKMEEKGLKNKDLTQILGLDKSYISAILNRKKPLTLTIAKQLHKQLGVSAEALLV
ncbi:helix-turn-helix domain-containing protein [Solitalea canadensis]|uniref:Putative transcription regulator containing HTH domain n=1 Tax=Solitalea canadensis (strain ATCC 29591 / DSM 3403 / JCM 21819 / LMG 8368 / NBRC 15130 / NCIMB 12057 / USAM 9D) TaxID=929556 RepID=H8KUU2_SOLCM|nr:helix-turn-helix domain-containing protein [Solitalea canadensis]AFD07576.1 putative transcription regulator containing HTH domain [Solitalea canadensis DSM 3403]